MNEKYLKLTKQFNKTVSQLCAAPAEFNRFLRVAAFNYRLTFQNAVLAYAQDTGSDLLLTYEQWQSYRRVPKLHTKATLLFDVNRRGRYVVTFPMSRTVVDKRVHRYRELRLFDYRNDAAVVEALKAVFQTDADNLTEILYAENLKRFESFFDDAYPAFDNETDFLAKAVTNMLMCRFGEEMPYKNFSFSGGINRDNIEHIYQMVMVEFLSSIAFGSPLIILLIVMMVCVIIVMVKLVARVLELTCLVAVAPVFFATLVGEESKRYFRKFFSAFLSTAAYIIFVAITYAVATKWVANSTPATFASPFMAANVVVNFINVLPRAIIIIACCRVVVKPPRVLTSLIDA